MKTIFCIFSLIFSFIAGSSFIKGQEITPGNLIVINPGDTPEKIIEKAANVIPSKRQYDWQRMEMTAFIHFGINTFNEVEWGSKGVDISAFNPSEINVKQWVQVLKDAGMKLIILTCKHHDGFSLWPSKYSDVDIANTPFQSGKGDIVRDLSAACRDAGLKFGVYLSPWDMNEPSYGTPEYNQHFLNQLTELLTNYGDIAEVWFDGANGEGPNGKRQVYDWQSYYKLIRKLQPNAVIAVSGPDVRWVGTESGYGRKTEWSVLPGSATNEDKVAANSQQGAADGAFIPKDLTDEDLGSREKILKASSLIWYPSEVDVSIRRGWFYKKSDDAMIKTPEKLVDIYFNSVGLNSLLLLNVPPDKRGLITDYDINSLKGMRYFLDETFKDNFVNNASVSVPESGEGTKAESILDNDYESYWTPAKTTGSTAIEIIMDEEHVFNCASIQENILKGQRVEKFNLEYWTGNEWKIFAEGTTIGYKRLFRFPEVKAKKIRIVFEESRRNPAISSFGIYKMPPQITIEPAGASFTANVTVSISGDTKGTEYFYTTNGSEPGKNSAKYTSPLVIDKTTTLKVIAISKDGKISLPSKAVFNKAKHEITLNTNYNDKYPGQGKLTLVDGAYGSNEYNDGRWQGYNGNDLDAVIDLGGKKLVNSVSSGFFSDQGAWIFLPSSVEIYISDDGNNFSKIKTINNDIDEKNKDSFIHRFEVSGLNISTRYVRIKANSIKTAPAWHQGAGDPVWIFADEITIQ